MWAPNTILSFKKKTNEPILRKLTDRRKDGQKGGQKEGQTDGPCFIGPFRPRLGVPKSEEYVLFMNLF